MKNPTPRRQARIPDATWNTTAALAAAEDPTEAGGPVTPSALIRAALDEYNDLRARGEFPTWWPRVKSQQGRRLTESE